MNTAGNTYHCIGPLNAQQRLGTRNNPVWKATAGSCFQIMFAAQLAV
jgi:hypothetical protein